MNAERTKGITLDELMRLDALHYRVEVVNGEVRIDDGFGAQGEHMSPGLLHVFVGSNLYDILRPFALKNRLGYVFGDGLIYLLDSAAPGIENSRIPDVSFIRRARILEVNDFSRPFVGAPDLAVEVVSPSETAEEVTEKIEDYLNFGCEQIWAVYFNRRSLYQYFQTGEIRRYHGDELVDVSALFPGLTLKLSDLFMLPEM
jgi:Uma2 family endonuclease